MRTSWKCKYLLETFFARGSAKTTQIGLLSQRLHQFPKLLRLQNGDRGKESKKVREEQTLKKKKNKGEQSRGKQRVEQKSKSRWCVLIGMKKEKKIGELNGDMRKHRLMKKKKVWFRREPPAATWFWAQDGASFNCCNTEVGQNVETISFAFGAQLLNACIG